MRLNIIDMQDYPRREHYERFSRNPCSFSLTANIDVTADMNKFRDVKHYQAVAPAPNCFDVSCLPWLSYTGFNLNLPTGGNYYAVVVESLR